MKVLWSHFCPFLKNFRCYESHMKVLRKCYRKAFLKTHPALRIVLMIVLFVLSIALVVAGWKMTGQLAGLGIMLVGVALLLVVLAVYNATYQD